MPLLWLLLAGAAIVALGGTGARIVRIPPRRATLDPDPDPGGGIRVWGTAEDQEGVTYVPGYAKIHGCKAFEWGVCLPDLVDELAKHPEAPKWADDFEQVFVMIGNVIAAGAGDVSKWFYDRACIKFRFPLYRWSLSTGEFSGWEVARKSQPYLEKAQPPFPLPKRDGWRRVWIQRPPVFGNSLRNEQSYSVYFPTNVDESSGDPVSIELTPTSQLRAMLRMDPTVTGAVTAKQLSAAGQPVHPQCGKARFWFSTRKKAMAVFR